jgi:hypothetical protein
MGCSAAASAQSRLKQRLFPQIKTLLKFSQFIFAIISIISLGMEMIMPHVWENVFGWRCGAMHN